ncbi:hypothetical protein DXG03_006888 [Asterophora parasitica]|uniref:Uncharacterized protein n=1 Tax=Asterophora parasitica TaxID=117018 RepID=A0A9P7G5E3_9AGAR|nr:hypothetical protein DXG03_006888 [Asterophora parasitica]
MAARDMTLSSASLHDLFIALNRSEPPHVIFAVSASGSQTLVVKPAFLANSPLLSPKAK